MPIYATTEALEFWKPGQHARTLAATHFPTLAESQDDSAWRKTACNSIAKGASILNKAESFKSFSSALALQGGRTIFAKLEARLILNAGDGVIENGGICLDRTSGCPYIPGSAIKACARRFAIHELSHTESPEDRARLLAKLSLVFGYGDTEWKSGRDKNKGHSHSDFWLAMVPIEDVREEHDSKRDQLWPEVSEAAADILFKQLKREPKDSGKPLASQLPNLAGRICFLPAYPTKEAKIEIDVLTSHHPEYYNGKKTIATDDENPIPIVFPAVAKGTSYQFSLIPNGFHPSTDILESANTWLAEALQLFGLGAKTNAGYGWFSIDEEASKSAELELLVRSLIEKYAGFSTWPSDRKDDAILELSDRTDDCALWHEFDPESIQMIVDYAKQQDLDIL